ncbi:major facilitator superfamily-domain-containing protein [Xylariales sp. PMI_506]|nr:major facilitator superfamily-domain-containing protein [Xylariales sp. PMI_506]
MADAPSVESPMDTVVSLQPPTTTVRRRIILLSLCLTQFLGALDITIVATALPTIASSLDADAAQYAWVGSSYTLASTAATPIWAKASDVFGRKPTLLAANAVFAAGSLVAALSLSVNMLIGGRVLQGLGSGGMLILVTLIISDLFELKDRPKYYGLAGLVWAIASATGPLLGGVFTQTIGWRWCFWINLPFELLSLVMLCFVLRVDNKPVGVVEGLKTLDWVGSILIVGGTICFLYGLESGSSGLYSWSSAMVVCTLVFGILILAAFFAYEARFASNPIFPVKIFSTVTNIATFTFSCLHSFLFITFDYFLPLYFQVVLLFRPLISGLTLFALVLPLSIVSFSTGRLVARTGKYWPPIVTGAVLLTLGTGLLISLGPETNWPKIILFEVIIGIGTGPLFQAPTIALQSHLEKEHIASAMSAFTFMRNLFASCSIVIGTSILQSTLGTNSLTPHTAQTHSGSENNAVAYTTALHTMWTFYTVIGGVMILASLLIKRGKNSPASEKG